MKRLLKRAAAAAVVAAGLGSVGCVGPHAARSGEPEGRLCTGYQSCVDPCWPERYNATARGEVMAPFATQVNNGHMLNQTLWNWYFEVPAGAADAVADQLNTAGKAKLDSIARSRPGPDCKIFLQAARDPIHGNTLADPAKAQELTNKRAAAVLKYLATQPTPIPVTYEIYVWDPAPVGMPAEFAAIAYRGQGQGYRGGLTIGGPLVSQSTGANQPVPSTIINAVPAAPADGSSGQNNAPTVPSAPPGGSQ